MRTQERIRAVILIILSGWFVGCAPEEEALDIAEPAQQIADVMASIDESGGSAGSLAFGQMKVSHERMYARLAGDESLVDRVLAKVLPSANASLCSSPSLFSSCSSNLITRDFGGCSIGFSGITISGNVTLTWDDALVNNTCLMASSGHSVTRDPNFIISGRRGATLTVSKSGSVGQRVTYNGGSVFTFTNDGIRRVFSGALGATFDYTTSTTGSGLTVTGSARNGRVLSSTGGAALRVLNNNTGVSCNYVPASVTWTDTCNCAVSGSWAGSCSDGRSPSLRINSCGKGTFSNGTENVDVSFDRCYSI